MCRNTTVICCNCIMEGQWMCRNTTVICCNCIMEGAVDVSQYYCDVLQPPSFTKGELQMFDDATRL